MRRTIALVVLGLALMVPGLAVAKGHYVCRRHHHHASCSRPKLPTFDQSVGLRRTPLSIALALAYKFWGVKPCHGHYRVEVTALAESVFGESSWRPPTGRSFYEDPAEWTNCVMRLASSLWTQEALEAEWPLACTSVLHEWGHLTGHPHSDEPGAPPEPPGTTPEQREVMRSGAYHYSDDVSRCGWDPYEARP